MNEKIEKILEFQKIRQQLTQWATSERGRRQLSQLPVLNEENGIRKALQETADGVIVMRHKQNIPIPRLKDIATHIKRLTVKASLNSFELADILRVLTTTQEVARFFDQLQAEELPLSQLYQLADQLITLKDVQQQLQLAISEDGRVLDDASPTLKGIRQGILKTEQRIRQQLDHYLTGKTAQYLTDQIVTLRNERYVILVKAEYRNALAGIVHDQSASGQTLFMEPQAVIDLNNRLKEYQSQERLEVERIIQELSLLLVPYANELEQNHELLAQFDMINAKAHYAQHIKASEPLINLQNHIYLRQARHPLIDANQVVANDIELGANFKTIVITGPNTGGKTILLKTVGMIQLMAQAGLFIPTAEESQIGIFTGIFADIGDEQSIEQNLSTFSSHLSSIIAILNEIDECSLVLLDEVGSGTDPKEGAALAISLLDYIASKGAYVIATTHYPELKAYGYNRPSTSNASMEFDHQTLQPTYRLLMGIPGQSNAFDISQRLGLPAEIIAQSRSLLSQEDQDLNRMIADLVHQRQIVQEQSECLAEQLEESTDLHAQLTYEVEQFQQNRHQLLEKAKEKANQLVEESQQQAEQLLAEIRSLQLKGQQQVIKEHELIAKKSEFEQLKHERALKKNKVLQKAKAKKSLQVGQTVEVVSYGQRGTLIEKISEHEWVVQMGIIKMKVPVSDLVVPDQQEKEAQTTVVFKSATRSHVSSELDLRGQRYEQAMKELEQYIDAALLAHYPRVTIIHGRGTGALQQGVHKLLRQHRSVASFEYAPINLGGNGATIVSFK